MKYTFWLDIFEHAPAHGYFASGHHPEWPTLEETETLMRERHGGAYSCRISWSLLEAANALLESNVMLGPWTAVSTDGFFTELVFSSEADLLTFNLFRNGEDE